MAIIPEKLSKGQLEEKLQACGIDEIEAKRTAEKIIEINKLKKEKNAVILGHYYMRDSIKYGIADYVGDSLDLAKAAMETDADIIMFAGVDFMAETAKILNPDKKVLLPSLDAGCSLAESITADDVKKLREKYPRAAIATYINTGAEVKAECDVVVTSANAPKIIKALSQEEIVFLPDKYMAANLINEIPDKKIITWNGVCIVHEEFAKLPFKQYRAMYPGIKILAHYECPQEVIEKADMHGGTGDMIRYIKETNEPYYFLGTECGLASTIKEEMPGKNVIGPCTACPYMKKITLDNIYETLKAESNEITVPEDTRLRAKKSLDKMLEMS